MNDPSRQGGAKRKTYSVFVGHLPNSVNKEELLDLFSTCGTIQDGHVIPPKENFTFTHGFVRYYNYEDAKKAVCDFNKWSLRNMMLEVEISHDTKQRLQNETKGEVEKDQLDDRHFSSRPRDTNKSVTNYVEDLMYLGRLKECCADVNTDVIHSVASDRKMIKTDELLDRVSMATKKRPETKEIIPSASSSSTTEMERIKNIFSSKPVPMYPGPDGMPWHMDVLKDHSTPTQARSSQSVAALKRKQKEEAEFIESLKSIMDTINTLVKDKTAATTDHSCANSSQTNKSDNMSHFPLSGSVVDNTLNSLQHFKSKDTISRDDSMESVESNDNDGDVLNNVDSGVETDVANSCGVPDFPGVQSKSKHTNHVAFIDFIKQKSLPPTSSSPSSVKCKDGNIIVDSHQRTTEPDVGCVENNVANGVSSVQNRLNMLMLLGRGRGLKLQK